ncbi:M1 family metallopeptidase [Pedobacter rhizosphaerae]|uniref:Aminopeptidase N n=1 Tax=Pedobacter rhizosphaerae TaxID=390241 RepID=A0A1H9KQB5_9SPHI|nr:M1 family aminopeptidase [Pedobacter rhizosphaerae]SER01344.1 aminopeptidase N [Pedobacter rhizosphaerae]
MTKLITRFCFTAAFLFSFLLLRAAEPEVVKGVSRELATYRKKVISQISYQLSLDIPLERKKAIQASESITFKLLSNKYNLQLDFRENGDKIKTIQVNGKSTAVVFKEEHIIIDKSLLIAGDNQIQLVFEAGEAALNRNADYLYTLFVPDRARTVFPCFDQPDLKATYKLSLTIPDSWKAIANAQEENTLNNQDRKTISFKTSDLLSTYLFSFAAGKFDLHTGQIAGMQRDFLYRETDTAKIKNSMTEIFKIHEHSLRYFENWTAIPYPFQKFGFVAIPDFQFGGMEHVGAIQYKASSLFLDPSATKDQLNARSNLIAHETAHMWFGDLVTMSWFNDVWMKEVFANFMADKSNEGLASDSNFDLKFLIDHFPAAYATDRTTGANPIRQQLDNLQDAGSMYGNIIYHKAPIMMRQLELLMGKEKFQQGIREYLKKFSNGNASWPELIEVLDLYTDANLKKWNKVWVDETGRPIINYEIKYNQDKIKKFSIRQEAEYNTRGIWPQFFDLTLFYPDTVKNITVNMNAASVTVEALKGADKPLFVLFNSAGQGYGLWPVDPEMPKQVYTIKNPVSRASAYITLYENMLNGRAVKPVFLLNLLMNGLEREQEELNLRLINGYISSIYWEFITAEERKVWSSRLEQAVWAAMKKQKLANNKKILFKTYQDIFISHGAMDTLYTVWCKQQAPAGVKLTEDDYTSLAFSLSLRENKYPDILNKQLDRITNPDRKSRFKFIMPAVSEKAAVRDEFFNSLALKSNREKEANVTTALTYLHHSLRQSTSLKYLVKSLDLLAEIQRTGDIFFPQNWLQATFGNYQSAEAAEIVQTFLAANPDYNPKLRLKILQAADNLFRAQKLLKAE